MALLNNQVTKVILFKDYFQLLLIKDLDPATIQAYRRQLNSFYEWLGDQEPSAYLAELFLADLRGKGYKRGTIRSYYHTIKPFMSYLGIPFTIKLKKEKSLPTYHSHDDIQRILHYAQKTKYGWQELKGRDILIIRVLTLTGLRRSELLALRCRDIREGLVFVHKGKGDKDRVIPLTKSLASDIYAYIRKNQLAPADALFPIKSKRIYDIIKGYALAAGIDDLSPHGCRHYFATRLIEKGAELKKVQELLGHEDISTTAIYLDVVPMHLKKTIELLEDE